MERSKSPVPSENSWTSSVHTMETRPAGSIMTARANSRKQVLSNSQTPRPATIASNITEIGDFYDGHSQITEIPVTSPQNFNINHQSPRTHTSPAGPATLEERTNLIPSNLFPNPPQRASSVTSHHSLFSLCRQSGETLIGSPTSSTGEQFWLTENRSHGHRVEWHLERGVISRAGPDAQKIWLELVQIIIGYVFKNPDLLEEALETPGSGVTCVGASHRHFENGNEDLAKVGAKVMEMILQDQFYTFKVPSGDASTILERTISRKNLARIGTESKLEQFIRPRRPLRKSQRSNLFSLMKDDAKSEDNWRTIARGMRAIHGAVYYDGGFDAARRLMAVFSLLLEAKT